MARQRQTALSAIPEAEIKDGPLPGTRVAKMPMDGDDDDDGFGAARLQEDALPAEGDDPELGLEDMPPVPGEEEEEQDTAPAADDLPVPEAEAEEPAGEQKLIGAFEKRLAAFAERQQRAFDERLAQLEQHNQQLQQQLAEQRQQDNEAVLQHQLRQLRTMRREAEQAQDYARAEQIEDRMEALRRDLFKAEAAKGTRQEPAKKPAQAGQVNPDDPFARQLLEDRVQQFRIYYDVTDPELRQVAALEQRMSQDPRWAGKPYQLMWKSALTFIRGQASKRGRPPGQPASKTGGRGTPPQRRGPDPMGIREAERQLREISERRKKQGA